MPAVMATPSSNSISDDVLLDRFRKGDRSALEELFKRYREMAYRVAYRLLGNEADALDALQEGFIKALLNIRHFEHRCAFKTWLLRIISNASVDLGRQRQRRESLSLNGVDRMLVDFPEDVLVRDPVLVVEAEDLRSALQSALEYLPEAQRKTFVLHVDGGLTYREVAETMNISIGTVMSRLFYARQKLKGLLASRVPV